MADERAGAPDVRPRYLVTWTDSVGVFGSMYGWGLINELDRRGFAVGVLPRERVRAAPYLTLKRSDADAVLTVAVGPAIDDWDRKAGVRRVTLYDPGPRSRLPTPRRLHDEIVDGLRAAKRDDLLRLLDTNVLNLAFRISSEQVSASLRAKVVELFNQNWPVAVFESTT